MRKKRKYTQNTKTDNINVHDIYIKREYFSPIENFWNNFC